MEILYYLFLTIILFARKRLEYKPSFKIYLIDWLKLAFKNKIIFINLFGNILLFIPLGYYKGIIKSILIVIIIELLQLLFKRGVFDIVDIILNTIGIILGYVGRKIYGRRRNEY